MKHLVLSNVKLFLKGLLKLKFLLLCNMIVLTLIHRIYLQKWYNRPLKEYKSFRNFILLSVNKLSFIFEKSMLKYTERYRNHPLVNSQPLGIGAMSPRGKNHIRHQLNLGQTTRSTKQWGKEDYSADPARSPSKTER